MAAPKSTIEFLPQEDWEKGNLGKILKWALNAGRHIVIFTELIVIMAFLSRFKFDHDLTDLGEKIKQQQAIINASSQFEKDFRSLTERLDTVDNLKKNQIEANKILADLAGLMPGDVLLRDFKFGDKEFTLTATALSETGFGVFVRNLKRAPFYKNLVLSQVASGTKGESGINFQIKGEISGTKLAD